MHNAATPGILRGGDLVVFECAADQFRASTRLRNCQLYLRFLEQTSGRFYTVGGECVES